MLTMRVNNENVDKIVYDFFPEDTETCGTFELNKVDGSINVIKNSPIDEHRLYLHHAVSKALEFYEIKEFENNVTVAWY